MKDEFTVHCCDVMDFLRALPSGCADLVLTDPPYNMGKDAAWDKRADYLDWMVQVFGECARVTREAGQLIFWHNNPALMGELWHALQGATPWRLRSFITVDKPRHRCLAWKPEGNNLRSWYPRCEYICHMEKAAASGSFRTGVACLHSHPDFGAGIRAYFNGELTRAGLTPRTLLPLWRTWGKGGTGAIMRHYFSTAQWLLPTREKYEAFFQTYLRAATGVDDLFTRAYDELAQAFEAQRQQFAALAPVHNTDAHHANVWTWPGVNDAALHACRKPVELLRRLVRVHTHPGQMVVDCFCGSGSTAEACKAEGRRFMGCDSSPKYAAMTRQRWDAAPRHLPLAFTSAPSAAS